MRDVCERTGLTRSAIHHYIREGLLPKPEKTGRNTATYTEEFVRRAQLVKALQENTHLPLAKIRETLDGVPAGTETSIDPERFAGVTRIIADSLRLSSESEIGRDELLAMTGLKPFELDALAAARLVDSTERNGAVLYSPLDARIVMAFARIRDAGATAERGFIGGPEIVRAYRRHLTEIARTEAAEMVRMAEALTEIDMYDFMEKTSEPLGDLVAALHRKALVKAVTELLGNGRK